MTVADHLALSEPGLSAKRAKDLTEKRHSKKAR